MPGPAVPPPPAPAPAPAAPATPPPVVTKTANKATFVDGTGQLFQVDASEAKAAEAMGLRPAALSETIQAEKNIAADSAIGKLIAGATGAVPLLSTALVKGAEHFGETPEDVAEAVSHSVRSNQGTHYTGMALGMLAPVGAARVAGALRGAAGATALARAGTEGAALGAEAVAGGAEAAAAGGTSLAATGASSALATIAKGAARVGLEGAAFGGAAGVDETVLGDPYANGQAILAGGLKSAGWGLLLGGVLGGAAAGAGRLLSRAGGRAGGREAGSLSEVMADAERVAAAPEKAFAEEGGAAAAKETAAAEAKMEAVAQKAGVRPDDMRAALQEAQTAATETATTGTIKEADGAADVVLKKIFGSNKDAYEAASAIWKDRLNSMAVQEARLDANAGRLVDAGNAALRAEKTMQKIAFGEAKAEQMAKLVDPAKWESVQNEAFNVLQEARGTINHLESMASKGGGEGSVKTVAKFLEDAEAKAEALTKATDKAAAVKEYFVSLDSLKRAVGKEAQFGKTPVGISYAARQFDGLYENMRVMLEHEGTWGKAGAAQREINASTAEALSTYQKFKRDFVHEYGAEVGRPTFEFRSDAAKSHLTNVLEFAERDKARGLADWTEGLERRLNAVEKHYGLTAAEQAEFKQGREALQKLRDTLGEASKDASTISKIRAMQAEERAGAIGGTLGMLGSVFTQPISTVARLGELKVVLGSVSERMQAAAKTIVGTSEGAATAGAPYRGLQAGASADARATASASTGPFTKRRELATAAIERVRDLSQNPTALASKITQATERYDRHAPQTSAAMAATMGRGVGYLAAHLPKGGPTQPSLQPLAQKPRYSDTEINEFLDRYTGVQDPLSLLADMESGKVSRAKVEAVREVYPEVFQKLQAQIGIMAAAQEKPMSWERTKMLAVVFGVPTHPAFDPSFIAAVQAPMQAATGEAGSPAQPSSTSRYSARPMDTKPAEYQSPTERMAVSP